MTPAIVIRPVQPDMLDTLVVLEQQTFTETFRHVYSPEDLKAFLSDKKSPEILKQELLKGNARYYICYYDNAPAGFLKLNMDKQPDDKAGATLPTPVMELEKIYVLQAFQGFKLGKALIHHAYAVAREHQVNCIWLGVWEHNTKARAFYEREGFERFGEHSFMVGSQLDTDWLYKKAVSG
ncbi:GNAT family N-acetyltransferase [uncultured Chitinophaga sp.]|jgi:Acetyltransferases|uniref:GNAT family N-acetyltransferase n=1 Tax=uncultured Chitinophaga sp. TaxID=339340 RepID=UPI00261BA6ED|nr:GNAT family N-acetyltransferase [uncultured Chitinophaga sp.]